MKTQIKFILPLAFALICLIGLSVESFYLWKMEHPLAVINNGQNSLPTSIEERLDASLDTQNVATNSGNGSSANYSIQGQFSRTFISPKPVDELGMFMEKGNSDWTIRVAQKG